MEDDELFRELAEDENIAAAILEHEQACSTKEANCPACKFYNNIHEIRHFADLVDAAKAVEMSSYPIDFVMDAQVIIQFLSEATQYFLQATDWDIDDDEEFDEEDDE